MRRGEPESLSNLVAGEWTPATSTEYVDVDDPATEAVLAQVPMSNRDDVDAVVVAAARAAQAWRAVPVTERIQPLFRLKVLIEEHLDALATTITKESGKTYAESVGELRRGIENIEVACGAPTLMQGTNNEDIARGIDEHMVRQPLGVVAAITPFNFPAMIPLWFMPYAVATGNAFILKPSEKVPLTSRSLADLADRAGFPPGVVSLLHGGKDAVDALLDHPDVRAVSFVGSTPVARYVYARATANGKRAQAQGGAKNPAVVMPDADMEMATRILADSAFGCAGQRCLATSVIITVGDARRELEERLADAAMTRHVGNGLDAGVEMGPVISAPSRERILGLIETGVQQGANPLADGRDRSVEGLDRGHFMRPTVLTNVASTNDVAATEIFGPVLSMMHARDLPEAISMVNDRRFGNQACLFTASGAAARAFRVEARAGNVGINLGVAAPIAFFPFSGWGDSFFGDLHAQGRHGVEFYTDTKVVVERWPASWSRTF